MTRPGGRRVAPAIAAALARAGALGRAASIGVLLFAPAACSESNGDAATAGGAAAPGAGSAALVSGKAAPRPDAPDLSRANLVIISLDTLRADATSMLGGPADITPALAEFASHSVLFTRARSQSPHTAPSHMTLFTGCLPSVHGVQNVAHEKDETGQSRARFEPLPEDVPTLAQILTADGFRSIGLTDGGNLNPPHGFARGFEKYTYDLIGAEEQVRAALPWVEELGRPGAGRFFLFWHTYQCHAPYVPPATYVAKWAPADYDGLMKPRIAELADKTFRQRWGAMKTLFWKDRDAFGAEEARYLRGLYLGGVDYADDQVVPLFEALREHGVFDSSIVVLMSDHGEEFLEHGHWQHEDVFEECLRVPLMIRFPHDFMAGRRIDTPVGLIDMLPTLLELLAVDAATLTLPGRVRQGGISLAGALLSGKEPPSRPIVSEHYATHGGQWDKLVAIHWNGMKFIRDEVRAQRLPDKSVRYDRYLFDLATDPGEVMDLAPKGGAILKTFEDQYAKLLKERERERSSADPQAAVYGSPEAEEQLIQLGYIDKSGSSSARPSGVPDSPAPR